MLPGMAKPRIAIVGAGNLGTALAGSLSAAGFVIDAVVSRPNPKSLRRARALAKKVGSRATSDASRLNADVIWLCVPDAEIAAAAKQISEKLQWKGKIALHSSGALTSDELAPLRRRGAASASVHPLMTFVKGSQPSLPGVSFAIEGDSRAARMARRLVRDLGGGAYLIRKRDKAAYHAWGTFASPLLTTLLATTERVASVAGVNRRSARQRVLPILRQTIENYAALGAAGGFSGPIIRGDVEVIRRHMKVLKKNSVAQEVYLSLVEAALEYLPAKNKSALKRMLSSY
jgi:predicted short-subunit dehydrogenase-like oxidoreductase (DUF2520 family)